MTQVKRLDQLRVRCQPPDISSVQDRDISKVIHASTMPPRQITPSILSTGTRAFETFARTLSDLPWPHGVATDLEG